MALGIHWASWNVSWWIRGGLLYSLGGSCYVQPMLKEWGVTLPHLFINYLFISVWTLIYFVFWIRIQYFILLPKLFQLFQLSPLGAPSVGSRVPLAYPIFFFFFKYFLVLQDAQLSSCIFSIPVLKLAIAARNPGFFYWRILEIKIWC